MEFFNETLEEDLRRLGFGDDQITLRSQATDDVIFLKCSTNFNPPGGNGSEQIDFHLFGFTDKDTGETRVKSIRMEMLSSMQNSDKIEVIHQKSFSTIDGALPTKEEMVKIMLQLEAERNVRLQKVKRIFTAQRYQRPWAHYKKGGLN